MSDRYPLLNKLGHRGGASPASIAEAESALGLRLPPQLVDVLQESDGLSGESGVLLYSSSELPERNSAWEVPIYAPGFIAIADNGGGRVALVRGGDDGPVLISDVGDMNPESSEQVADSIGGWLRAGCAFSVGERVAARVRVMLVRVPAGGLRDLIRIRDALSLAVPVPGLKDLVATLPVVLVDEIPAIVYARRVEPLGQLASVLETVAIE